MRPTSQFALCAFLICSLSFVFAGVRGVAVPHIPPAAEVDVLKRFEERYRSAGTLAATFLERYRENGSEVRVESGKAYFMRPRKMRWEYEVPEKNIFLADGKYVWFYAPADHTVTRVPAKQSDDWRTPLAFLTTGMKLSRICSQVDLARGQQAAQLEDAVFRCLLRTAVSPGVSSSADKDSEAVIFEVTPQGELARIVIPQKGGLQIEFAFKDWEWNPKLPERLFRFEPPRGVAVVDGLLPETPGLRQ